MERSDFKYLIAYLAPLFGWAGIYLKGWASPGMFYLAFVIIPLVEPFLSDNKENSLMDESRRNIFFFDFLLYLHVPIVYSLLVYYLITVHNSSLTIFETFGLILNMGTLLGAMGINIGHELGHRKSPIEKVLSQLLLLPSLYMHFQIEHNLGHHKNVATPKDPSTARLNEPIYLFWLRSITGVYLNAWRISEHLRKAENISFFSFHNKMLIFTIIEFIYLSLVWFFFGFYILVMAVLTALVAVLLLESVNYIEHYGLRRKILESGRYEPVQIHHSWNSNHSLGRIFLFELTRHADHHYKSTRPYQILRHYDESPQLPMGYPAAIILSLIPPIWFKKINPLIK